MALAPYYHRAAVAASHVIAGFDEAAFRETLGGTHVGLSVGTSSVSSPEAQWLADFAVRMLARLYPALDLRVADSGLGDRLSALAIAINPDIELRGGASVGIAVGGDAPRFEFTQFAGSKGWDALVSRREPLPTEQSDNPFGAGAAACLAVGEVFKRVLLPDWENRLNGDACFSTFHLEKGATEVDARPGGRFPDPTVLVGAGAIGNAALWALGRAPLSGSLHVVDAECVDLGNLQRYVLTVYADVGKAKTGLAREATSGSLTIVPHAVEWAEYVEASGQHIAHAMAALDSAKARRSVQAALPLTLTNAWTQAGDLGVSVHGGFGGAGACLYCLYLPTGTSPSEDALVAGALGIPELVSDVRTLLYRGESVPRPLLELIASRLGRPAESVLAFEGRTVRDLYVHGICGGGVIPLGGSGSPRAELHVPLAHQSALAGILLASAAVRQAITGENAETTLITRINVMAPLGEVLTQPARRRADGVCICEDPDYLSAFRARRGQA